MASLVWSAAGAASIVFLAGCGSTVTAVPHGSRPSRHPAVTRTVSPSSQPTAQKTCGRVTPSTGILRNVLQVHLSGPSRLVTGSLFKGVVTVSLRPGAKTKQVFLNSGDPILPVITRGAFVMGAYEGAGGGRGVEATVAAGRPYRFGTSFTSGSVLLRGCPDQPVDSADPDRSRKLLAPGRYVIYAYVDDLSGNNTSKYGVLRSQPLAITVTGKPS